MTKSYHQKALARRRKRVANRERLARLPITQAEDSVSYTKGRIRYD